MSRKRARTATTPVTEPAPPKIKLSGGIPCPSGQITLWQQGQALDCTITAGGSDFEAHRLVLMSGSPFFLGAFTPGMSEAGSSHVTLPEMTAAALEAVLSFLYTGEAAVDETELLPVLSAAAFLQISSLFEACASRLEARLTSDNALETWELAESHSLEGLATAAKEKALADFEALAQSEAWLAASLSRVHDLLSDGRLTVATEEAVHTALVKWANAQRPPPTDATLLPLFRSVRYPLVERGFFEQRVATEPLLQGSLGIQVFTASFASLAYDPPIGRRPGFGPVRPSLTWSREKAGRRDDIEIDESGKIATGITDGSGIIRSAQPLPATGTHLVELVYTKEGGSHGDSLGYCYMTGVLSAAQSNLATARPLGKMADGFWGVDDYGGNGAESPYSGLRRGSGLVEGEAKEARTRVDNKGIPKIFVHGDRVGLLVDMDARTLTFLRDGEPIHESLVFHGLPEQVYIVATPFNVGAAVRIV